MQACKHKKLLALSISFSLLTGFAAAQYLMDFPSMPSFPDGPSMPDISSDSSGFYSPVYTSKTTAPKSPSAPSVSQTNVQKTQEKQAQIDSLTSESSSTESVLNDYLSAADLNILNNNGLLSGVYNLLGKQTSGNSTSSYTTEQMLSEILDELKQLKQNQGLNADNTEKSKTASVSQRPQILRFTINGYNVLETCRSVYFSRPENDGTFLLTGDRRYTSDNQVRNETFYLLFKSDGNSGSQAGFNVSPSVVQDTENKNSFLYQLSGKSGLKASKTGNLVVLKYTSSSWNMDLLLDIGR